MRNKQVTLIRFGIAVILTFGLLFVIGARGTELVYGLG